MIIRKIKINNFRIYKGEVSVDLTVKPDRNVIVIFGENGFGKTTFLLSILWCLYGKMIVDVDDTLRKHISQSGYKKFLDMNLNNHIANGKDQHKGYSVEIDFEDVKIPSVPCESLSIRRSFDYISKLESVDIKIDGHENELAKQIGYDLFINDFILNKDIARLFFFDSERIVNIADDQSDDERKRLSNAYNQVLGVKKYEDLKQNLLNLKQKYIKAGLTLQEKDQLEILRKRKEKIENDIRHELLQIEELNRTSADFKQKLEQVSSKLMREGSKISVEELNKLEKEKAERNAYKVQIRKKLNSFLDLAPFAIAGSLFEKTKHTVEHDYKVEQSKQNFNKQNEVLSQIKKSLSDYIDNTDLQESQRDKIKNGLSNILSQYTGNAIHEPILLSVDQHRYDDFISVYHSLKGSYQVELNNLIDENKQNKIKIEKINKRIHQAQVEASDAVISELKVQASNIRKSLEDINLKIPACNQNLGAFRSDLEKIEKKLHNLENKAKMMEADSKKDELVDELTSELSTFLIKLKNERKRSIEGRIRTIMNNLMHKQEFIKQVTIEENNKGLTVNLLGINDILVDTRTLSKGEQQLFASALLQALVEESKIDFPVFIDSPLQKFDEKHTETIISDFYPKISRQVVLFPIKDKELTAKEYELLSPICYKKYSIINDIDGSKIISIQ